jgi:succinate dehydrogenase/fumarate reductase flavoprotein subunit
MVCPLFFLFIPYNSAFRVHLKSTAPFPFRISYAHAPFYFPPQVITYAQLERLEDLSVSIPERVKVIKKARVTKLLKDASGTVVGVEYVCGGKTEAAYGPVILATGGYAADFTGDSLLKKYRPEYYDLPTTNGEHSTGDGHKLALSIGASAVDLEKVQVHPTGLVDPKEPDAKVKFLAAEALRGVGGLLLDNTGKRFVDELQHRDYVTGKIWENGKYPIRLVLNGKASKDIEWHCKHYVGRGLMKRFDSGEALAKEFGLAPEVLKKTFEDYNVVVRSQKDPFGKKVRISFVVIDTLTDTRFLSSSSKASGSLTIFSTLLS